MSAQSIISHRMFVAALGHKENGAPHKHSSGDGDSDAAKVNGARHPRYRTSPPSDETAGQLWFAAITDGLKSAEG